MKKILLTLFFAGLLSISYSQFYKNISSSPKGFSDSLNAIIKAYASNYRGIQGELIEMQNGVEIYKAFAAIPGAQSARIFRFQSKVDTTASWQAIMCSGVSFKDASKIYRNLYNAVKKAKINFNEPSAGGFYGEMQPPEESMRFIQSDLRSSSTGKIYQKLVVTIELTGEFDEWEVKISISHKRDDSHYL